MNSGLIQQSIFYTLFISFNLAGCSQSPVKNLQTETGADTLINKKIEIEIEQIIDTGFLFEPRFEYKTVFDSLTFETGVEDSSGIYTYRGSNQRNSPVRGTLMSRPAEIVNDWIFTTGADTAKGLYGVWGGGAGWTGQPLIAEWDRNELKEIDGLSMEIIERDTLFKEIIQVSLAGKVYFIDFETGKQSRAPIVINNPVKGTPAIDGRNKRYLMVGQGIQNRGSFGWRVYDLRKQSLIHVEYMPSPFAFKMWGANDATPLIETKTGIFIWPTESGIIYRGMLGSQNLDSAEQYRYKFSEHPRQGIESSPSVYRNLGYFTDNAGNVFCIDLRNMKPRWHFFNTDDTDGSPVVEVENDTPYVYVGNEVDLQGSKGKAHLRKLNGLTGTMEWQYERDCYSVTQGARTDNGGMLCTPATGINKAHGLIWTIFSRTDIYGGGAFVCLNDSDGSVKYEIKLNRYSWVSPIALYDTAGNAYIYFSDVGGNIYLIDGLTGEIIFTRNMEYIFESSPVAVGNRIIQPARGNRILSFRLQ